MLDQNTRNSCAPSILTDTYEASCGSLPDVHNVSSEIFRNNLNASAIEHNINLDNVNFSESFSSTSEKYSGNKTDIGKKSKSFSKSNYVVRNLFKKGSEFNDHYYQDKRLNRLENAFEVVDKREIVENYWDTSTISGVGGKQSSTICKSYNNTVKIKVVINSDNLKKNKRKPYRSQDGNYTLQIELSGNDKSHLKVTNNKHVQVNTALHNRYQSEMIDCKESNTVSSYSTKNDNRIKQEKRVEEIKRNKKSTLLLTQSKKLDRNLVAKRRIPDSTTSIKHGKNKLITTKKNSKILEYPDLKPKKSIDTKLQTIDKSKEFLKKPNENQMKDKFVQTLAQKIKDNTQLKEDQDLIKLGMWLEILNNSEYNIYNQDFCVSTSSGRIKATDSRILENERNFQSFLKEMGHFSDFDMEEMEKGSNYEHHSLKQQTQEKQAHSADGLNLQKCSRIFPIRHSLGKTKINGDNLSLESVNLTERSHNSKINCLENEKTETQLKKQFSTSTYSSFRKLFQSLFTRILPNSNTDEEDKNATSKQDKTSFFSYFSLTQENPPANLWNKINPFIKFSNNTKVSKNLLRKILEERKKSFNNVWKSKSNHFQYNFPTDNDVKYYQTQYDGGKINFQNNNNYYNEEFDSFTNSCPQNCAAPNYPYDTIPFMQCPGGCDVCNPDLNKVPNIDVSYYY